MLEYRELNKGNLLVRATEHRFIGQVSPQEGDRFLIVVDRYNKNEHDNWIVRKYELKNGKIPFKNPNAPNEYNGSFMTKKYQDFMFPRFAIVNSEVNSDCVFGSLEQAINEINALINEF